MTLSEIAAGIEVTTEQRDRGVATVDDTGDPVATLREYDEDLPCDPEEAVAILEAFAAGTSVGGAAREAGVVPVTAARTLHLLGLEGVSPLGPTGREVVRDWLSADLTHAEARELSGAGEREFALAAFVETHDPLGGVSDLVEGILGDGTNAAVDKRDRLAGTMTDPDEFL